MAWRGLPSMESFGRRLSVVGVSLVGLSTRIIGFWVKVAYGLLAVQT